MHVFISRALQKVLKEAPKKQTQLREACKTVIGAFMLCLERRRWRRACLERRRRRGACLEQQQWVKRQTGRQPPARRPWPTHSTCAQQRAAPQRRMIARWHQLCPLLPRLSPARSLARLLPVQRGRVVPRALSLAPSPSRPPAHSLTPLARVCVSVCAAHRGAQGEGRRVLPAAGAGVGVAAVDAGGAAARRGGVRPRGGDGRQHDDEDARHAARGGDGRRGAQGGRARLGGAIAHAGRAARRERLRQVLRAAAARVRVQAAARDGGRPRVHPEAHRLRLRARQGRAGGQGQAADDRRGDGDDLRVQGPGGRAGAAADRQGGPHRRHLDRLGRPRDDPPPRRQDVLLHLPREPHARHPDDGQRDADADAQRGVPAARVRHRGQRRPASPPPPPPPPPPTASRRRRRRRRRPRRASRRRRRRSATPSWCSVRCASCR